MSLVLASGSPRRRVLLRFIVADFEVRPVDVEEVAPRRLSVKDGLEVIARKKALAASRADPDAWVLAADTVVHMGQDLLHKPRSRSEARLHLARLADDSHEVSTGLALAHRGGVVDDDVETSKVTFARLPSDVVDAYVQADRWVGKAGGYGIQDPELAPFVSVEGNWSNVVGLPLARTYDLLMRNDIPCKRPPSEAELAHHNPFQDTSG